MPRLAAWAAGRGLALDAGQWGKLERYSKLVLAHNARTNITAAKSEDEIADRHLADGLAALPLLRRLLAGAERPEIADVGSGAGFIGVALQIAWPEARVSLVESSHRKFLFLNWAVVELALPARAVWRRAAWKPSRPFDAAVERALAPLEEAAAVCAPLIKPGGCFVAYTSDGIVPEKARAKLERIGAAHADSERYTLPGEARERTLLAFRLA